MEAIANFFRDYPDGQVWYNEAEAAFDTDYAHALGIPFDRVTYIEDCTTVEDMFTSIDSAMKAEVGEDTPGLYIVDSLDSLSDTAERGRGIADPTYGGSKARKLSEVFRRIAQDLKSSHICLMIISQVRDNIGVSFGEKLTRSGGKALDFYASQVLWLAHVGILKRTVEKVERPVGIKIRAKCKKNKVGFPFRECDFEISFGYGIEDAKASRAWLTSIGRSVLVNTSLQEELLRNVVKEEWFRIERSFLPTKHKYGGDST